MSSDIEVIALKMVNMDGSIIIDYFSFEAFGCVNCVSLASTCNTELCNSLEAVYFCRTLFLYIKNILVVWKLTIPPRVHFFFWLLSKNKLLTRDNLGKRRKLDDQSCMLCSDREYMNHLFFECVVTKRAYKIVSEALKVNVGSDYEFVAKLWLCNKKFGITNMVTTALCWSL
jgi:hypothetical protein